MGMLITNINKSFPSSPVAGAPAAPLPATATSGPTACAATAAAARVAMAGIDVEQMLNGLAAQASEKLNRKSSIVDLMKLPGLVSSLASRKELAHELNYTRDMNDSASMNVWLHRQVMTKMAANSGKEPADLKN